VTCTTRVPSGPEAGSTTIAVSESVRHLHPSQPRTPRMSKPDDERSSFL
jgi:hypothetical protein